MKRLALITVILGSALALVPVASADARLGGGVAYNEYFSRSSPYSDPATQAVLLRSKGLSTYYGSSGNPLTKAVPLSGKSLAAFYDTGAVTTSQPAVTLTGKDLAAYYDTGAVAQPIDPLATSGTSSSTGSTTSGDSTEINWSALIGAILLGVLLIGMAATAVTRRRHQPSF